LHERLLRIRRAPGGDQPKEIVAWLDPEIVATERPTISRSSSASLSVAGRRVVLEGITRHHLHEHGGDAARIASMEVRAHNATGRALPVELVGLEWLSDHGCGAPSPAPAQPASARISPDRIPSGVSTLRISFDARSAYQGHCDVFASRARLRVDGAEVVVTAEHEVTRIEPLQP
jgi:hypothetical protein